MRSARAAVAVNSECVVDKPRIAFIGAGNMASSIVGGLVEAGHPVAHLAAADPFPESLQRLQAIAPVATFADNRDCVADADIVMLAVKPQKMAEVCSDIAGAVQSNGALVVSIAAGINIASMQSWLGENTAIVRCMPNTPALLGAGASALHANAAVSAAQREQAQYILGAVGTALWVPQEQDLDAVTALSGSGPAYFFLLSEAMINAGCELGLSRETATALANQTALGAARMALENDVDLVELRRRVTSPGGTTQAAVEQFERDDFRSSVDRAMRAAFDRAVEMAEELG